MLSVWKYIKRDGLLSTAGLVINFCKTKVFFRKCRLIRFPVRIRGFKNINFGQSLTTGYGLRIDAFGKDKEQIIIGKNVELGDYVHIAAIQKIQIGDGCLVASKVYISDHDHGIYSGEDIHSSAFEDQKNKKLNASPVYIGKNVWIGEGVAILKGVSIGENSIIGAASVVMKSIPSNAIAVGCPARVVKIYDKESNKWKKVF